MKPFGSGFVWLAVVLAVALTSGAVADEKTLSVTVRSGVEGFVSFSRFVNDACISAREPNIVGISRPKHGTVAIRKTQRLQNNPDKPCEGRYLSGTEVLYRSSPGYAGTDEFIFDAVYPNGTFDRIRAAITVTR